MKINFWKSTSKCTVHLRSFSIVSIVDFGGNLLPQPQPAFSCSMLTMETLEQGVKYVQS